MIICSEEGCQREVHARGLCHKHYIRVIHHGSTTSSRPETWGMITKHPLFNTWSYMKRKSGKKYSPPVCPEWLGDFRTFVSDVGERPSHSHKLKLIDETRPYSKENVYWAAQKISVKSTDAKERACLYQREYRKRFPANIKQTALRKVFGIDLVEYERLHTSQNGVCAICGGPETAIIRGVELSLAVDHCHTTGKIRGLLCRKCNNALGGFRDSKELLGKAIAYLAGDV